MPALVLTLFRSDACAQCETEMKLWKNYMTPGNVHDTIAMADSEWLEKISIWMDPNISASTETVTSTTNKMI